MTHATGGNGGRNATRKKHLIRCAEITLVPFNVDARVHFVGIAPSKHVHYLRDRKPKRSGGLKASRRVVYVGNDDGPMIHL